MLTLRPIVALVLAVSSIVPCLAMADQPAASGLARVPRRMALEVEGNQASATLGNSVASAGDVNGDGYDDVIIGANGFDHGESDEGRAYVYYGSAIGFGTAPSWTAEGDQAQAFFGQSVATAGDVNGDGYADVIVGAHGYDDDQFDEGRIFLYYGSPNGLSAIPDWIADSDQDYADLGVSVGSAGDVNRDGYDDIIAGAYLYGDGEDNEGAAFVYLGSAGGPSTSPDWIAESNEASAFFGVSVGTAGDVNGDGYDDVIVGARNFGGGGAAFVYHGSATGLSPSADWLVQGRRAEDFMGTSAGTAGDVNGDGYDDVIVGAQFVDHGERDEGAAFVYDGSPAGLSTSASWIGQCNQAGATFGFSGGTAGDYNRDGYADVIVGAQSYDHGENNEGAAFVYFGSATGVRSMPSAAVESNHASADMGNSVGTAGDVNGDGYDDVIVGAWFFSHDQVQEGLAAVYLGRAGN